MPTRTSRTDLALVARLRVGVARLNRQLREQGGGLSPTRQSALVTIEKHGPLSLGELATIERVAPATVTKIVTRLADDGLVARTPDPDDRRTTNVALTELGVERLAETRTRRNAYLARRLGQPGAPTPEELRLVVEVLEELARTPEEDG